jgi:hypothetical protein
MRVSAVMPPRRRITDRDLEVLEFVARFGLVPGSAAARWARTSRSVTYRREARWRAHGLVRVLPSVAGSGRLLTCTRDGLQAVSREGLRPARVSVGGVRHAATVAWVAAELEPLGERILSELEIMAIESREGQRLYSAELSDGHFHRPDLVLIEGKIGVEVELTQKASWRLDSIMRGWRSAIGEGRLGGVRYLCWERALRAVNLAVERTCCEELIDVDRLTTEHIGIDWDRDGTGP